MLPCAASDVTVLGPSLPARRTSRREAARCGRRGARGARVLRAAALLHLYLGGALSAARISRGRTLRRGRPAAPRKTGARKGCSRGKGTIRIEMDVEANGGRRGRGGQLLSEISFGLLPRAEPQWTRCCFRESAPTSQCAKNAASCVSVPRARKFQRGRAGSPIGSGRLQGHVVNGLRPVVLVLRRGAESARGGAARVSAGLPAGTAVLSPPWSLRCSACSRLRARLRRVPTHSFLGPLPTLSAPRPSPRRSTC